MPGGLICVIPAKGHSHRLPGKNGLSVGGVPLTVRAVQVACASGLFEAVVVSTDDQRLARLSEQAGAQVPFVRSPDLTQDTVEVGAVVHHALAWFKQEHRRLFQWVCTLQPTSPLRTAGDVRASWALLENDPQADAVVSVSGYHHHPYWALRLERGALVPERPDQALLGRMYLPAHYHPDGCVYWQRAGEVLAGRSLYDGRVLPYHTPAASAVDVDSALDLAFAEFLLQRGAGQAGAGSVSSGCPES